MKSLRVCNSYGNVDVRVKLSRSYAHIPGPRLQPLCRKLGVRYAKALVGFSKEGRHGYKPVLDGVVVSAKSAPKLLGAIEERSQRAALRPRATEEQLAERRKQKQKREAAAFAAGIKEIYPGCSNEEAHRIASHACAVGSGRVGRTSSLPTEEKVRRAVVAHVRHCHTDYEDLLRGWHDDDDRADAREAVSGRIRSVLEGWETPQEVS